MSSDEKTAVQTQRVRGPAGALAVYLQGDAHAPVVFMTHSILSASMMWYKWGRCREVWPRSSI